MNFMTIAWFRWKCLKANVVVQIVLLSSFHVFNVLKCSGEETTEHKGPMIGLMYPEYYNASLECSALQPGQYICSDPEIDNETQQAVGCSKEKQEVEVPCYPVKDIYCSGKLHTGTTIGFYKKYPCKWTNGKDFGVALLLSVFLGWLGVDRFYLGYPALGLVKFCTFGFMFLWHLVDILLIAMQVVGPADGSHYIVDYYGAAMTHITRDNNTYILPPDYTTL